MIDRDLIDILNAARAKATAADPSQCKLAALLAENEALKAMNAKVAELEKANAELAADRDNWRQQALAEDARANAATETTTRKRKGK